MTRSIPRCEKINCSTFTFLFIPFRAKIRSLLCVPGPCAHWAILASKGIIFAKNRRKIKAKYQALSWNWYWLCCCCCYQVDNYLHIKGLVLWLWLQIQDSWGAARPLDAGLAIQIYLVDSKSVRRSLGLGTTLFSESCLIISSIYKACSSSWRAANFFNMTKTNMK